MTDVYDFPARPGSSLPLTGYDILPVFGIGVVLYTVVQAYVSAGYLGRLHSSIISPTTLPSFLATAGKYFVRILVFGLLLVALSLFSLVFLLASPLLFVAYFVFFFVLGYFLFLTPFIIVADDATLSQAVTASIRAASSSRTLEYAVLYSLATVLISIFVYIILNIGFPGFILAIVGFAFVGTGLVASTFHFIARPPPPAPPPAAPSEKTNIV